MRCYVSEQINEKSNMDLILQKGAWEIYSNHKERFQPDFIRAVGHRCRYCKKGYELDVNDPVDHDDGCVVLACERILKAMKEAKVRGGGDINESR